MVIDLINYKWYFIFHFQLCKLFRRKYFAVELIFGCLYSPRHLVKVT